MATNSSILAGKIPWSRSLEGYSPWGCKESDMTEASIRGTVRVEKEVNHKRPFELRNLGFILMWGH